MKKIEDNEELFIDMEDISDIDELKYALKENVIRASKVRREIENLKSIELHEESEISESSNISISIDDNEIINDDLEYEFYYDGIKDVTINLSENEIKEILKENLPSKQNSNYAKLINRIKAEIFKELLEYSDMVNETTEKGFLEEIKKYVNLEETKLKLIDQISLEQEKEVEEITENKVVFFETLAGNIYAIEDLESIEKEYYDAFKELYDSIKNGTFKNAKRFNTSNSRTNALKEVRGFKTRIIFDRLDKDTYIILQVFVKKCDNDKGYRESIIKRNSIYRSKKNEILEQLSDEDYINKNLKFEEQFLELLNRRVKKIKKGK